MGRKDKPDKDGDQWETVTCPTCGGSGKRGTRACGLCNGSKTIQVPKR